LQVVGFFEVEQGSQDRGVIFVAPKLRRIENVIARQFILGEQTRVGSGTVEREIRSWMRQNFDPFLRHAVKKLHPFLHGLGPNNNECGPFQTVRIEILGASPLSGGAYLGEEGLEAMLQIQNNREEREIQRNRLKRRVEKEFDFFTAEHVVDPLF